MKNYLIAAALAATALSAVSLVAQSTPAPAPKAMKGDTNADGTISRAEFLADAAARFTMMDADKNGQITREERRAAHGAMRGMNHGRGGERGGPGMAGRGPGGPGVTGDRMGQPPPGADGGPLAGMERMGGRGAGGGGRMLERLDADKDGKISRAEYATMTAKAFERANARGISKADFDARQAQRFTRMDANLDGYIDAAERAALPQRPPRPAMGDTPPPPPPPGE
jgi:hypothetical protein